MDMEENQRELMSKMVKEDEGNCANPENLQNPGNPEKFKKSEKIQQHPDNPGKSAEIEDPDLP